QHHSSIDADIYDYLQPENCLKRRQSYGSTGHSVIGVQEVPEADTHRYGIIDPLTKNGRQYEVKKLVEKPAQGTAPSNLAIMGRYVLTPEIFDYLKI
ncbi:sugar phosphate nucleotidyltransferase, partial [Staphylococcus aureus]|uniref:sugar phosphate nucleotidyltransferase n=1 Tax=Staphylococcus aureus TaxID=1280 RepID=UPI00210A3773